MSIIGDSDRAAMRDGLSRLLDNTADEAKLRTAMETPSAIPDGLWKQFGEMGLLGISINDNAGGIGGGAIDTAMVMGEIGRHLVPVPYVTTCVVAAPLLEAASNESAPALLERTVAGEAVIAIGGTGGMVPLADDNHSLAISGTGDDCTVSGSVSLVLNGGMASHYLFGIGTGADQTAVLVEAGTDVSVVEQQANDPALRPATLICENAKATVLNGLSPAAFENARLRGVAALAAEQAGAARAIFDITVEYLKTRYQFGRPIGSFQALKHMAADLLVDVESATSAARSAALAIDAQSENAARSVALAGFICADAFREVSAQAIQMHGGIAYTREHVCHLYWRRARAMQAMFGNSDAHRERYLQTWEAAA